ncbi:MAG TPA: DUF4340 domain-containing protein [Verrucomicrobiae bacterium]|nr:DUF4340 domain-containing protein [Verrucomicrobiae bacterium]
MNSKTTGIWFVIAAALFAFILIFEHFLRHEAAGPTPLLPNFRPADVTRVQVYPPPPNALEINASRTNGSWLLTEPVVYPAQSTAVEALLDAIKKLAPERLDPAEFRQQTNSEQSLGFENPQARIVIAAGDQNLQLVVGNLTAPGDQVYLRVVGREGVFVADAGWLRLIPRTADAWRDTALVDAGQAQFDWIVLTNNVKGVTIELRCDPTNHLWRMIRPLQSRADADHITDALQQLETASVTRFVTDDTNADLAAFGLQPSDLDLWLGRGTNMVTAIHVGKSATNDTTMVYAQREGWSAIFLARRDALAPWRGTVNDFRDTRLFELTAPVAEIEVNEGDTNHFVLREPPGTTNWSLASEKYPVDTEYVQSFIKALAGLRISDFVQAVATAPDLPAYGLDKPRREIVLRSRAGDTNAVIADLQFGLAQTNKVFVRCAGEDFVYAIPELDYNRLPDAAWQFRDRQIWNFKGDDVTQITIHQNGRTRQIVQNSPGKWSLAPGSSGIIEDKNIEQAVELFQQFGSDGWLPPRFVTPDFGFDTNSLQITFELKNGDKNTVEFGGQSPQLKTALAAVTLDGKQWCFLSPPAPFQIALSYLTIPSNVP